MQHTGNILKHFIKEYNLEDGLKLQTIKVQWTSLVGHTIAAHTSPDIIKGKTIFIIVDTPQWMHHLSFYKQELSEKLEPYKIEDVRFRIGRVHENLDSEHEKISHYELSEEDSIYIENTIGNLKDDELKEKFRTLLTDALRHGRK